MELRTGSVSDGSPYPPAGTCYAMFGQYGDWYSEDTGMEPTWEMFVTLHCTRIDGAQQASFGAVVGDLLATSPDPISVQANGWYSEGGSGHADSDLNLDAVLTVVESVGGKAELPDVITSDFKRVIRFDLAPGQAEVGAPNLGATLHFTLEAQSFHYRANAECRICAG